MSAEHGRATLGDLSDLPTILSVEEGGAVLGLSRSASYRAAREFVTTNGRRGLPVIQISPGRKVVPVPRLLKKLGIDPSFPVKGQEEPFGG